jgi:OmpA-OmpF porin, OOP family
MMVPGRKKIAAALLLFLAAAPADACIADWRMVFFAPGSAALDDTARTVLDTGVIAFFSNGDGSSRLKLSGNADRSGDSRFNMRLSRRRAEAVRDYLAAAGVPVARIDVVAMGEAEPLVATPDGEAEAQNRYVRLEEILTGAEGRRRSAEREASGDTIVC